MRSPQFATALIQSVRLANFAGAIFAIILSEYLFVNVTSKMERLDSN